MDSKYGRKDIAIILKISPYKDNRAVLMLFGRNSGLFSGIIYLSSKNKNVLDIGNLIFVEYKAISENAPTRIRLESAQTNFYSCNALHLRILEWSIYILRHIGSAPDENLFQSILGVIDGIRYNISSKKIFYMLLQYEYRVLKYFGVGIVLDKCAVTNNAEDLAYISPKTGAIVSREIGNPYRERLFVVPKSLFKLRNLDCNTDSNLDFDLDDILQSLNIVFFFISKNIPLQEKFLQIRKSICEI